MLRRLSDFCSANGYIFPPTESKVIADFLCDIADTSLRPNSSLNSALAAMTAMYTGLGQRNLASEPEIGVLKRALVKGGTSVPRKKSSVMPVNAFRDLFMSWGPNETLPIKDLRLKAICLLSLTIMLRPSDIAPRAQVYDPASNVVSRMIFSTNDITFELDGSVSINFMGIKNDVQRTGFVVKVPKHDNVKLDPVAALKAYIARTEALRPSPSNPVFVSLKAPYHAITSSTVSSVLESAITLAGLDTTKFSAKSFRPTGATVAIEEGNDPDVVMKLGRWKTASVFYEHYVHSRTPLTYTNDLLNHQ
jgi:hypothetical protein